MRLAVYPGTFDPPTLGHVDLVRRALDLCDRLHVVVAQNASKRTVFSIDERVALMRHELAEFSERIVIESFDGLIAAYAARVGAVALIRGLRAVSDFEYEFQMALMNRSLSPNVQTIWMPPDERFIYLNSTIVREVSRLGGDVSRWVSPHVEAALRAKAASPNP